MNWRRLYRRFVFLFCIAACMMLVGCKNKPESVVAKEKELWNEYTAKYNAFIEKWIPENDPEAVVSDVKMPSEPSEFSTRALGDEFRGTIKRGEVTYNFVYFADSGQFFINEKSDEIKEHMREWAMYQLFRGSADERSESKVNSFAWKYNASYLNWSEDVNGNVNIQIRHDEGWLENMYPYEAAQALEGDSSYLLTKGDFRIGGFEVVMTDMNMLENFRILLYEPTEEQTTPALCLQWYLNNNEIFRNGFKIYNKDRRWKWTFAYDQSRFFKDVPVRRDCVSITKDRLPDFTEEGKEPEYITQEVKYYYEDGDKLRSGELETE